MVSSGTRTGVNHSLSVQAFFAAESGLEWAGLRLKEEEQAEAGSWVTFCEDQELIEEEFPPVGPAVSFFIEETVQILNDDGDPIGCEISVSGWVGSDRDNPLAKRQIKGTISESFVTAEESGAGGEGGSETVNSEDFDEFFATGEYEQINERLNGGGDVYIEDEVQINNDIGLDINGGGNVFIGNNVSIGGRIIINISGGGDVCIGDNINIENSDGYSNALIINISGNGNVCVGNYENLDEIVINITGGNSSVCFAGDSSCSCESSFCELYLNQESGGSDGEISQNPTGQGGTWSEG